MWVATKKKLGEGQIGSAVLLFNVYKQTNTQTDKTIYILLYTRINCSKRSEEI